MCTPPTMNVQLVFIQLENILGKLNFFLFFSKSNTFLSFIKLHYCSFITLHLLFYLGDFGERGTTSEKNKAFSSHMGDAT